MQCGSALVKVTASCKKAPGGFKVNTCKNYQLRISNNNTDKIFHLPYMPDKQRKTLERQGYQFNNIVEAGDWEPKLMKCYDDEYIIIGYNLGLTEEETVKESLILQIGAPFFNLQGEFVSGKKLEELRERELNSSLNYTLIDFISDW